jgi:hypothetical protein
MTLRVSGLPQPAKLSNRAGRWVEMDWPDALTESLGAANGRLRNASDASIIRGYGSAAAGDQGSTQINTAHYLGFDCAQIKSIAAGTANLRNQTQGAIRFRTTKHSIPYYLDPRHVQRFIGTLAFDDPAANALRDCGMEIMERQHSRIIDDTAGVAGAMGVGIICRAPGVMTFISRQVNHGAISSVDLTAAPFDTAAWHAYEMRVTSATAAEDAKLEVFIDDVLMLTQSWGAGTTLPENAAGTGYQMSVMGPQQPSPASLYVASLRYVAAPTLTDTQ